MSIRPPRDYSHDKLRSPPWQRQFERVVRWFMLHKWFWLSFCVVTLLLMVVGSAIGNKMTSELTRRAEHAEAEAQANAALALSMVHSRGNRVDIHADDFRELVKRVQRAAVVLAREK
jgi:ABC-type Fe3+ transport system permease subunit